MAVIRPTQQGTLPDIPVKLCRSCGTVLDDCLVSQHLDMHPNCEARLQFQQPVETPGSNHPVRTELINLIRWADRTSARSRQLAIGPSEIGSSCDRRLAMRMAAVRSVNRTSDPWPAIVGTAMHDWLQRCLMCDNERLRAQGKPPRWLTETPVAPDPLVHGTSDVYDTWKRGVVDWKSMGETAKKKLADEGPSFGFYVQIQVYGLGFHRAGLPVDTVGLMFLPRAGKLSDARYFEWPFDPATAQAAIARVYQIGNNVLALQQQYGQEMWHMVPADPTALCGWCPFFRRGADQASSAGCPGK